MKVITVSSAALAGGWEPAVHIFAHEHQLIIDSPQKYRWVKELMETLQKHEQWTLKLRALAQCIADAEHLIDRLKEAVGWPKDQ